MSYGTGNLAHADVRREERDDVHYRARAVGPESRQLALLIVNISPHGLMARCETCFEVGDRIHVNLPVVGSIEAEVRWSLGGRIGCQFDTAIELASYYDLVTTLVRGK